MNDGEYDGLMRTVEIADEALEEYGDLLKLAPMAKYVVAAYKWTRTRRIRTFILGLDATSRQLSDAERERFTKYVRSKAGIELLADFAESVVRSSSPTVIGALAVLYSDRDNDGFDAQFKARAVQSLDGLAERIIDAFLVLMDNRADIAPVPDEGPYPTHALRDAVVTMSPQLAKWSADGSAWVSAIHELTRRGLFAPDPSSGMRLGDDHQTWCSYFGISDDTERFADLLRTSRECLKQVSKEPG